MSGRVMQDNVGVCLREATDAFEKECGSLAARKAWRHFVPGRIEVLGKHSDYAGGRSLLAATSCGGVVVSALSGTNQTRVVNANPQFAKASFAVTPDLETPIGPWTNYPMTVARRLARNFGGDRKLQGVDIA